jgi:hypothetical protein
MMGSRVRAAQAHQYWATFQQIAGVIADQGLNVPAVSHNTDPQWERNTCRRRIFSAAEAALDIRLSEPETPSRSAIRALLRAT